MCGFPINVNALSCFSARVSQAITPLQVSNVRKHHVWQWLSSCYGAGIMCQLKTWLQQHVHTSFCLESDWKYSIFHSPGRFAADFFVCQYRHTDCWLKRTKGLIACVIYGDVQNCKYVIHILFLRLMGVQNTEEMDFSTIYSVHIRQKPWFIYFSRQDLRHDCRFSS